MSDAIAEAVEGLVQFTNDLMQKAQAELKVTTDKIESGTFTANDAFDGMVRASTFWVNSMASMFVKSMDTATILAKYTGIRTLSTKPLSVGKAGPWTLAITEPLTNAQKEVLAAATLEPAQLTDGATQTFVVKAVVQQVGGGLYAGVVTATDPAGQTVELDAKIQVA